MILRKLLCSLFLFIFCSNLSWAGGFQSQSVSRQALISRSHAGFEHKKNTWAAVKSHTSAVTKALPSVQSLITGHRKVVSSSTMTAWQKQLNHMNAAWIGMQQTLQHQLLLLNQRERQVEVELAQLKQQLVVVQQVQLSHPDVPVALSTTAASSGTLAGLMWRQSYWLWLGIGLMILQWCCIFLLAKQLKYLRVAKSNLAGHQLLQAGKSGHG